ncbi:MAG: cytochrome c3 family protein [Sumerlaeia bacterium]
MSVTVRSLLSRWRVVFLGGALLVGGGIKALSLSNNQGYQPTQPIYYSHALHAGAIEDGGLGMECLYCHGNAEVSHHASVPSVDTCMTCHAYVQTQTENIQKLTEYYENNESVPWVRIHRLPDHVYFPHKQHVAAGVSCQTCHGPMQDMEVVYQAEVLSMGWCISCHRDDNYLKTPATRDFAKFTTHNAASEFHSFRQTDAKATLDIEYVSIAEGAEFQTVDELKEITKALNAEVKRGKFAKNEVEKRLDMIVTNTLGYNNYAKQTGPGAIDHVTEFQNANISCVFCHH